MRGKLVLTCCVGMLVLVCIVSAVQASVFPLSTRNNRIDFNNWEYNILDANGNGLLDIGDRFRGVTQAQNLAPGPSGTPDVNALTPGNGIYGVFEVEVYAINATAIGTSELVFGPSLSGWQPAGISADAALVFWNHPTLDGTTFDATLGTDALVEAQFLDGTENLLGSFGFLRNAAGAIDVTDTSLGYFLSGAPTPPTVVPPAGTTQVFWGMETLDGPLDALDLLGVVIPQINPYIGPSNVFTPSADGVFAAGQKHDLVGRSQVNPLATGHYTIFSQDPTLIRLIPEPASILVWCGLGLVFGLCAIRRRRS